MAFIVNLILADSNCTVPCDIVCKGSTGVCIYEGDCYCGDDVRRLDNCSEHKCRLLCQRCGICPNDEVCKCFDCMGEE